jgi:hypothetical protein
MMAPLLAVVGVVALVGMVGTGAYFKGMADGAEPYIEKVAVLEAAIRTAKAEGDARAQRSDEIAKEANASLAKLKKKVEADRETSKLAAATAWGAYFDAARVRPDDDSVEAALRACRADARTTASAITQLSASALIVHDVATVNTEQLKLLQRWVREVVK